MSVPVKASLNILFPQEGETWAALSERLKQADGELLLILSGRESELLEHPDARKQLLQDCKKIQQRLRIATKHPAIAAEARGLGIRVLDRTKHVKALLQGHPRLNDALRVFSPQLWRQQLKNRLQRMGLLSVPKLRIFSLVGLSIILFFVVIFRLLPSAEVHVRPRQESVSQTINIFLVQSGAGLNLSQRVRRMPLVPFVVDLHQSVTIDHVSKEFIGTSATVELTIINKANEQYSLRGGTRFTNQAGMVFRIQEHAIVDPGAEVTVRAKADDLDLYGQIIGDRGNVPAGLKWEIPGLSPEERVRVYAENKKAGVGGTTAYRTVMRQEDIDFAQKKLEKDLLTAAQEMVNEKISEYNAEHPGEFLRLLNYGVLTRTTYKDFVFPTQFLGQVVTSFPIEGGIRYTAYAYDADAIFAMLQTELHSHVRAGRRIVDRNLDRDHLVTSVIDYDDDLSWVKLTVDLVAIEEYILDPLSPAGALFGKKIRERVTGVSIEEALRVIRNMPEVERVSISQWPPWNNSMPRIPSHISIITE